MEKNYSIIRKKPCWVIFLIISAFIFTTVTPVSAQYFGQNRVRYKNLKFKVYQTPHFELYHYINNDSIIFNFAKEAEVWYDLHQQVFRDTFNHP